ncbi:hypothetical protein [Pseudanabaena sp. FACHB-2040]|uniref:hypothetical protein n=1 Tax=Pseudanabaena sp. FACHB-2040 TaxID=2692859 RepID=UPI0016855E8B|nr:hypothetical protein [Pseudanabaena sp. FACHB-2040]MBD2261412.1 hypothetical protein [Pseudanabaena sp. FACHB-2040]
MSNESTRLEELKQRYFALAHAMQTGVAFTMEFDPSQVAPKHLRVGVNSAMVEHSAVVRLLLEKGIFTELEFYESLCEVMEEEAQRYKRQLREHYGGDVDLA